MCGRYVNVSKVQAIEKKFGAKFIKPSAYQVSANVSTGDMAPVITDEAPSAIQMFQFGFTPQWAGKKSYVINARAEGDHNRENLLDYHGSMGIINKPMFRNSIRSKRCLVVADAFIEGPQKEKLRRPYLIYRRDKDRPFAFAGIWDQWADPADGTISNSFAIITSSSNALLQKIGHHRSPVILDKEDEAVWLNRSTPLATVTSLLHTFDEIKYNAYPIDANIRSPKNKSISLLQPTGERVFTEFDYQIQNKLKLEGMGNTSARQRRNDEEAEGNR